MALDMQNLGVQGHRKKDLTSLQTSGSSILLPLDNNNNDYYLILNIGDLFRILSAIFDFHFHL